MIRTIVNLEAADKLWLDRKSDEERVSIAELIRRAVRRFRQEAELQNRPLQNILEETSGIWQGEDGLAHQRSLRSEWDHS